jgi:MarR family transcriptional regulator, transcriptional regulator for hemolysin
MARENLDRNFGFIMHDVARLMRTGFDRRVRRVGLTRSQWWVLTFLYRREGVTQSELAEDLDIEKATLGRLLDRLEASGWVARQADAKDRRVKRLHLTPAVAELMATMREIAAEMRTEALAGIGPEEAEQLVDILLKIKRNMLRQGNGATRQAREAALAAVD